MTHHKIVSETELIMELDAVLRGVHPSVSIAVLEKLGKKYRRENAQRIYSGKQFSPVELERPDLDTMK